ncbi:Rrf2 family transcriptional regulator [Bacillus inaquosorum]|uniref:Rrf2 family transcriptional regulator n=1 Tax=Bacillus inaquosorum TaxID=483913 RepID=UPI00228244EB|nr:Rrf2 family transcriptional regulator [Bacillus inaquosorum]MCY7748962.1 Rrf2 family transcriptional regulator [Bacillus inaquosorum]MCY7942872.1 Rrf2 family transcriptional regulator [Bacillus inaquosorum]MCY7982469.1 Rrf2 family transcriptional regulator [Bacillus inaquosorum]MCY8069911.1 Rrf2 family transcriptional regulator [Bacillus inaquosorum]MCY8182890.1 Rrf2 family transcriptional regulator [Bacillus inaquosorum]
MKMKSGMEQAVSVLLLLSRLPVQSSLTSEAISQRLRVSPSYLKKLMRTLVQAGLAESIPGTKGGFTLTKPLTDITLYNVYQAVEGRGSMYQGKGLLQSVFEGESNCVLEAVMGEIEDKWANLMREESLQHVMDRVGELYDLEKIDDWVNQQLKGQLQ